MHSLVDPLITANLYARGLLDQAISGFVLPVAVALHDFESDACCRVWMMRYLSRGEHLKVRIHCSLESREVVRAIVADAAQVFLPSATRSTPPLDNKASLVKVPAIDLEDEQPGLAEDLTLVWTTYRRTHVVYSGSPWLNDDEYIDRASRCLAAGCQLVLNAWRAGGIPSEGRRQSVLARAIVNGLQTLTPGDTDGYCAYLAYHRDWLLRYFILDTEKERETLRLFAERRLKSAHTVSSIQNLSSAALSRRDLDVHNDSWISSLENLFDYLQGISADSTYDIDPFARHYWFPPMFKSLHALANQMGVRPIHEAYVYDLLLAAVEQSSPDRSSFQEVFAC